MIKPGEGRGEYIPGYIPSTAISPKTSPAPGPRQCLHCVSLLRTKSFATPIFHYVPICVCLCFVLFFLHSHAFLRRAWVFSRALGCGARRRPACTPRRNLWVPGGLRSACSGRSKLRNMARNHGVAFRGARAEQDNGKPTCQLFFSTAVKALSLWQPHNSSLTSSFCGPLLCVCGHCMCVSAVLCYDTCR